MVKNDKRFRGKKTALYDGPRPTSSFVRRASITKWAPRISQERLDQESPNITRIFVPAWSTAMPEVTSKAISDRKLLRQTVENAPLRLRVEVLENGLPRIINLRTYYGKLASQTCRIWRHYLLPVSCKMSSNTAEKCKAGADGHGLTWH